MLVAGCSGCKWIGFYGGHNYLEIYVEYGNSSMVV